MSVVQRSWQLPASQEPDRRQNVDIEGAIAALARSYNVAMRRGVIIAALVATLVLPALAQMRGAAGRNFGGRGFAGRSFGSHGFGGFGHGGFVVGTFHSGLHFRTGFHGRFGHFRSYNPYAYGYYPYAYYGDYGYSAFNSGSYSSDDPYQRAAPYMQMNQQLSDQVNRLSDEVDRLRDEQASRQAAPDPPASVAKPSTPDQPTVLAFRDGHKEEVRNYAIVGQTLWILSDQRARKLALADLDVAATTKLNEERGSDFQLPE